MSADVLEDCSSLHLLWSRKRQPDDSTTIVALCGPKL
jgi:hypothetical protein